MGITPRSRIHRVAAAAALASAIALTGCAAPTADAAEPAATAERGGDLLYLIKSLNNGWQQVDANNNWYGTQVWVNLVEGLFFVDEAGTLHPSLATGWTVSEDGLEYLIELREGITFSDGTPLDAATVAANLDFLGHGDEARGIPRARPLPAEYDHAEVVDDSTVKVVLSAPNSGFIPGLSNQAAGILSLATIELPLEEQSRLDNVHGTGPFVVESFVQDQEIVLVPREDYAWGPETANGHTGPAYLDRLTVRVIAEDSVRLGALESGQADGLHYLQPNEEVRVQGAGFEVLVAPYQGTALGLELRTSAAHVDELPVRQAIQHAIDRDELVATVFSPNWRAATSVVQQSLPGWADLSADFAFDPALAAELLDEAGWVVSADGIRERDGVRLALHAYPSPLLNVSDSLLQLIAQQLAVVGIDLQLRPTDASSYASVSGADDLPIYQNHNTSNSFTEFRVWWSGAGQNRFRAGDPELDALLDEVSVTVDETGLRAAQLELQQYLIEQAYYIPLVEGAQTFAFGPAVQGIRTQGTGRPIFYDTWVE